MSNLRIMKLSQNLRGDSKMIIFDEMLKNTVVTLYSEDIEEEFVCGFIVVYDENELVLACIDYYGENDGYLLLRREGVYRIDFESAYEKRIEQLYYLKEQKHEAVKFCEEDVSFMDDLFYWAFTNKKVVTMGFFDDSLEVSGYLENPDTYKITRIDQYECKTGQGSTYVEPKKASYIRIDSRRSRDAEMVYKRKRNVEDE